tara:strand:+ start:312 stop:557 length:246 start_codon:yes stop_codon:yes gene_type:complete
MNIFASSKACGSTPDLVPDSTIGGGVERSEVGVEGRHMDCPWASLLVSVNVVRSTWTDEVGELVFEEEDIVGEESRKLIDV